MWVIATDAIARSNGEPFKTMNLFKDNPVTYSSIFETLSEKGMGAVILHQHFLLRKTEVLTKETPRSRATSPAPGLHK